MKSITSTIATSRNKLFTLTIAVLCTLLSFILLIGVFYTIDLTHPFGLTTHSRALYVDEGFYADTARTFTNFGNWAFPHDFQHWPAAPILTVIQTLVMSQFGASITTVRAISIVFSVLSCIIFFLIVRTKFDKTVSFLLVVSCASTFGFFAHARSALADPSAFFFALLSILCFVKIRRTAIAIPLSILFALTSHLTKQYYLTILLTVVVLWIADLFIIPYIKSTPRNRTAIFSLVSSVTLASTIYAIYLRKHHAAISLWTDVTLADKKPEFSIIYVVKQEIISLMKLAFATTTHLFLIVILISIPHLLACYIKKGYHHKPLQSLLSLTRADCSLVLWLLIGLLVIGSLQDHKAHYYYFSIFLISFLASSCIAAIFNRRYLNTLLVVILVAHISFQVPYYSKWLGRPNNTALTNANKRIAEYIQSDSQQEIVQVIGESSSTLALYGKRINSLDVKWYPRDSSICVRLEYWQPAYHINIMHPNSRSEISKLAECPIVKGLVEQIRVSVFNQWGDDIVMTKISYK